MSRENVPAPSGSQAVLFGGEMDAGPKGSTRIPSDTSIRYKVEF